MLINESYKTKSQNSCNPSGIISLLKIEPSEEIDFLIKKKSYFKDWEITLLNDLFNTTNYFNVSQITETTYDRLINDSFNYLINNKKKILPKLIQEKVLKRLRQLHELDVQEISKNNIEISLDSLNNFFTFFQKLKIKNIKYPSIAKSYNGNLYIEWCEHNNYIIGIEFLRNSIVSYSIIITSYEDNIEENINLTAISSIDKLLQIIKNNNIDKIISI